MEELDEFEVLWPDACSLGHPAHEPKAARSSPPSEVHCFDLSVRSRPVDVPRPPARSHRWRYGGDEEKGDGESGKAIVPPHLLLSGRRRSEGTETAWTPCKRVRDLRQLRDFVLRMTGFIEG